MNNNLVVIGISGKMQHGKDSVANILAAEFQFARRIAFADAVYDELAEATGLTIDFIKAHKVIFRPVLQWWATDFRRKLCGENYWIARWLQKLKDINELALILCPDVRFKNEADCIQDIGGVLLRVVRPSHDCSTGHQSEIDLDHYNSWDFLIVNDGDLEKLNQSVQERIISICTLLPMLKAWKINQIHNSASLSKALPV